MFTSSDTRLESPGEGPLFESYSNKRRGPKWDHYSQEWNALGGALFELNSNKCRGQNVGTIRVIPEPLFMSGLGPLPR